MAESKDLSGEETARAEKRTLILSKERDKQLTKAQQAFNRLVKKIESLNAKLRSEATRLDALVLYFAEHVAPREERVNQTRRELLFALEPYLEAKGLKARDRATLKEMIAQQLGRVIETHGGLPEEFLPLFEKATGERFEAMKEREVDFMRMNMDEMLKNMGMNIDLSGLRAESSEEEIARETARVMAQMKEEMERLDSEKRRQKETRKKKPSKREEQAKRAEEARKTSISKIYRGLARVLHPDLEPDEAIKPRKAQLMAQLTAAYRDNDLHTILRLELEWIQQEDANLERMTDEKLGIYNKVLQEQAEDLKEQLETLLMQPQYRSVVRRVGPFEFYVLDGPKQVRDLDEMRLSMEASLAELKNGDGLKEVREAVRIYRLS